MTLMSLRVLPKRFPGTRIYRSVTRAKDAKTTPGVAILRFDASLYFANVLHFSDLMYGLHKKAAKYVRAQLLNARARASQVLHN